MDALKKIEMLKKGKEMSPMEKKAKMGIMKDIQSMASKAMGDKLGGLKKVTVAADSQEGLEEGLEKAEDIIEESPEEGSEMDSEEINESPDSEYVLPEQDEEDHFNPFAPKKSEGHSSGIPKDKFQDMSHSEIDQKIKELLMQKKMMEQKS